MNKYGNAVCDILRKRAGNSEWEQIYSEWLQLHNFTKHYIHDIALGRIKNQKINKIIPE